MKQAIITGASGFLGRQLTQELLRQNVEVLAVGSPRHQTKSPLPEHPHLRWVALDLNQPRWSDSLLVQTAVGGNPEHPKCAADPAVFYHLAWRGTSGDARADWPQQLANVTMTMECLKAAKQFGCRKFICAGSLMEKEVQMLLNDPGQPLPPGHTYSAAKLMAHQLVFAQAQILEIEPVWAIITNVYGPGERSARFVQTTLKKMIRGEALALTKAEQWYDFLHVGDAARALCLLGQKGRGFTEYTVGSGEVRPLREFIQEMHRLCASASELGFGLVVQQGASLPVEQLQIDRLEADTGFGPEISFAAGILETLQELRDRQIKK